MHIPDSGEKHQKSALPAAILKAILKSVQKTINNLVQRFLNPHILSACYFCQRKAEEGGNAVALLTDGAVCQWHTFSTDRNGV
ncbi:hypothetical protein D7V86_15845 [bacterium D16-51]|nr:hypothetical protein D7V96_23795 [bacterium D16-59]RKI58312.1 hypothetical protein D7V86_15845 [bacterium D16-51]